MRNILRIIRKIFASIASLIGWISWIIVFVLTITLAFLVGFFSQVVQEMPLLDQLSVPEPVQASRIFSQDNVMLGNVYAEEGNRIILSYDQIPTQMRQALIAIEDRDFYNHKGIDFRGISRAFMANIEAGGIQQGGSTITQQLVRKLFLEKESDTVQKFMRKIKEMIIALRLESRYSKDEILTFYLNEMFFGANSFGVEAAAHNYFGKSVSDLSLGEVALIAGLPQAPSVQNPYATLDLFVSRSNALFEEMFEKEKITEEEYKKVKADLSREGRMPLIEKLLEEEHISKSRFDQVTRDRSALRRNMVLRAMLEEGYITHEEYEEAANEEIVLAGLRSRGYKDLNHPYYATYVLEEAKQIVGQRKLFFGGLRIYTTLDTEIQQIAEEKIQEYLSSDEFTSRRISQSAFVLLDNETGAIKAMVGGVDFDENEFNRAWQARRQPGSAFKPFVYMAALEQGYSPGSYIIDEPTVFHDKIGREYTPRNYDHKYLGVITMKSALERSRNVPAVKTCDLVTPEAVVRWAKNLGIRDDRALEPYISIALGTGVVSVLDVTSAFSTIANNGVYNRPYAISMITNSNGEIIYEQRQNSYRVAPENLTRLMTYMLQGVVSQGTGTRARISRDCAGKTGTTSDHKDAWFIGYTPEYAATVWVGNDDEAVTMARGVTGGLFPARIWHDIMEAATANLPPRSFEPPHRYPEATMALDTRYSQAQLAEKLRLDQEEEKEEQRRILDLDDDSHQQETPSEPDSPPRPEPDDGLPGWRL